MDILLEQKLKRLEDGIALLEEQLISMKRHYEDLLNNLDEDNFSANYKVQQGNMYSKIEQTAEKIEMEVGDMSGKISKIEQTSKDISFKVGTYWDAIINVEVNPEDIDNRAELLNYTDNLVTYRNQNYYYNTVQDKWIKTDSDSMTSQFLQTASGFKLNGDVLIDGNTFVNGEFSTATKDSVNVSVEAGKIAYYSTSDGKKNEIFSIERTEAGYLAINIRDGWKLGFSGDVGFSGATITGLYAVFE